MQSKWTNLYFLHGELKFSESWTVNLPPMRVHYFDILEKRKKELRTVLTKAETASDSIFSGIYAKDRPGVYLKGVCESSHYW